MITAHACYLDLAVDPSARQQAYRKLFHNLIDEGLLTRIRKNTNACGVIGDSRFKEQIAAMLGRTVPTGKRGRPGWFNNKSVRPLNLSVNLTEGERLLSARKQPIE